jgi:uncharacterized protein (DUF488 family)
MAAFDILTLGHSNIPVERFLGMLRDAGVNAVADVRSVPASRHFPWFSKKNLAARLAAAGIGYTTLGDALGGRPRDPRLYRDGVADYEAMAAEPQFLVGLARLTEAAAHSRICLLCAEREPLDCHRCLLIGRRLAEGGMKIGHILHDGTIEPHATTEQRLLALDDESRDLFAAGQGERLAAAYRRRAHAVAFRQKNTASRRAAENG